jgi:hypothetical protein
MRIRVTILLASLATVTHAQYGAEVTVPPNAHQTGLFPFANSCPTVQMYKISAPPSDDWLRVDPSSVNVGPGTSFAVRVNVNSTGRKPGAYGSTLSIICATCAATYPPCLQNAKDFAIRMTVANGKAPSEFSPLAPTDVPPVNQPAAPEKAQPIVPREPPQHSSMGYLPWVALTFLVVGLIGAVFAMWSLFGASPRHSRGRLSAAESERHRVRR